MRTFSTLFSLATVLCVGLADAQAQQAQLSARPIVRHTTAHSTPGDPFTKSQRAATGNAFVARHHAHAPTGLMRSHGRTRVHQDAAHGSELRGGNPANDACANATALTVNAAGGCPGGAVSGDNSAATSDNGTPACDVSTAGFQDVWYSFNSGANTQVVIDLTLGTIEDIGIELLQGGCAGTSLFCDFSSTSYTVSVTANTSYRLRLFSNNDFGLGGTFDICLSAGSGVNPPPNDLCADANIENLSVPGSVTVNGDNTGATDTEGIGTATAWEAFTISTCADVTVNYCGTDPVFGNAFLSLVDDCSLANVIDATSNSDCGDGNIAIVFSNLAAGTYWFPVLAETGSEGPYTIEFSAVACGGSGAPPNDLCSNVTASTLAAGSSVFFDGTTENATNTNDGAGVNAGGDTVTVWHAFTTTECTDIAVAYCGTPVLPAVYWAALFEACPADDAGVLFSGGNFDDCADGNATIFFYGLPAGTWYLPVRGEPATWGAYTIEVSATACANAGPYCDAGAANTGFETIGNVLFAGIDNTSIAGPGYQDFTGQTGVVTQGQAYPIDITVDGGFDTDQALVWIDFDQSDSFEAGELVFTSVTGVGPYSGTITIPGGAATGSTRMRIRLHDTHDGSTYQNTPNYTPCDTSTYGQVEDYTILVSTGGPAPENDECDGAVNQDLAIGSTVTFTGDNTGATDSSGPDSLGIAQVWETFTITECADLTIDYCGTEGPFGNAFLSIFIGCPFTDFITATTFDQTTCSDGNVSLFYTNVPAGQYYYAVMNDPGNGAVGTYTLNVSATACSPGPVNDDCTGAIMLDVNLTCETTAGTVQDATQSLPAIVCNNFEGIANDDVWYSFVATGPNQTITVDGTDTLDAVIQLFEGGCGSLTDLACSDTTFGGDVEEITTSDLVEGTTYFVRVYDFYNGYPIEPTFDICVTGDVGTTMAEAQEDVFTLRPNPSEGQVTIGLSGIVGSVRVDILDVAGRLVQSEQRQGAANSITFDLSPDVSAGIYTVRLTMEHIRSEQRLLVK
jgi:hypothetical protein